MNTQQMQIVGFGAGSAVSTGSGMQPMHSSGTVAFAVPVMGFKWQNVSLKQTLERIAVIHARMGMTSGNRTEEYIREARAGGMYGSASDE